MAARLVVNALTTFSIASAVLSRTPIVADDCNDNGIDDALELGSEPDLDCDGNGVIDTCELAASFSKPFGEMLSANLEGSPLSLTVADFDGDSRRDFAVGTESPDGVSIFLQKDGLSFVLSYLVPTTDPPVAVSSGDVDGDGGIDLVMAVGSTVGIARSGAEQGFEPIVAVPLFASVTDVLATDVDRDGTAEIVTGESSGFLRVLKRSQAGDFLVTVVIPAPAVVDAVHVADMNVDGLPDLLSVSEDAPSVLVSLQTNGGVFASPTTFAVGSRPIELIDVDVDDDGDPDVVVADLEPAAVWLLRNDGSGSLLAPELVPVAGDAFRRSLARGNFDRDAPSDLVVGVDAWSVQVLRGTGDGPFTPWSTHITGDSRDLQTADLDGDGYDEILVAAYRSRAVSIVFSRRLGRDTPEILPIADNNQYDVLVADLDDDGDEDIVNGGALLRNLGDGTLRAQTLPAFGSSGAVADFDGDGDADLVTAGGGGHLSLLRNRGNATFDRHYFGAAGGGLSYAAGDFDSDGDLDVVTARYRRDDVAFALNDGAGRFERGPVHPVAQWPCGVTPVDLDGDGVLEILVANQQSEDVAVLGRTRSHPLEFETRTVIPIGEEVHSVTVIDFDADSRNDIIVAGRNSFLLYRNDKNEGWEFVGLYPGGDRFASVATADFDGDGLMDFAIRSPVRRHVSVQINSGAGTFSATEYVGDFDVRSLTATDVDGDAAVDLVAGGDAAISVFRNRGDGTFRVARSFHSIDARDVLATDLDGDALPELIAFDYGEHIGILENAGGGDFQGLLVRLGTYFRPRSSGDVDGNGKLDVIGRGEFGFVILFQESGERESGERFSSQRLDLPNLEDVVGADVNRDGLTDLVGVTGSGEGRLQLAISRGGGLFDDPITIVLPGRPGVLTSSDVDADGAVDLVIAGRDPSVLWIYSNTGTGNFVLEGSYPSDSVNEVRAADLDGDGLCDLVLMHLRELTLGVRFNSAEDGFATEQTYPLRDVPESVRVFDTDNDGRLDLVVSSSLEIDVWRNTGDRDFVEMARLPTGDFINRAEGVDLDRDGYKDIVACMPQRGIAVFRNRFGERSRGDVDENGVLDACETFFIRGDCDGDGAISGLVSDALFLLRFAFLGGPSPRCRAACDFRGDGSLDDVIGDAVYLLSFNFLGGRSPPSPWTSCGGGTQADSGLGCVEATAGCAGDT